jgi:D-alanyl-lipoteichoic acid acyltransferase DltB (MBOAT superfamily)
MVTMLLGGLWHGAGWGFVLWGAYHGALLVAQRLWSAARGGAPSRLPRWLRVLVTFHLVCVGWLLFRAPTLDVAWRLVERLGIGGFRTDAITLRVVALLLLLTAIQLASRSRQLEAGLSALPGALQGVAYASIAVILYLAAGPTHEFIYFQF